MSIDTLRAKREDCVDPKVMDERRPGGWNAMRNPRRYVRSNRVQLRERVGVVKVVLQVGVGGEVGVGGWWSA